MSLNIYQLHPETSDMMLFHEVKRNVYEAGSLALAQSDELNPEFLKVCFVVTENGIAIARLAFYVNPQLNWQNEKACCIGNFESLNRPDAVELLFSETDKLAKELGFKWVIGPMNGSTWDNYRFSLHNNYPNFLSEPYHHLYYNDLFLQFGFSEILTYESRIERGASAGHEEVLAKINAVNQQGIILRSFDKSRIEDELKQLFPLIRDAFRTNTLYTEISWETFRRKYLQIMQLVSERYVIIAEKEGEPVAFGFTFLNAYPSAKKQLVFKTLARKYGKEFAGIGHVIAHEIIRRAAEDGVEEVIHAFMIKNATSTDVSNNFASQPYKSYALYAKELK